MNAPPVHAVTVGLDFGAGPVTVGRLAIRARVIYFEYDRAFLASGMQISPWRLPLEPGLKAFDPAPFEGLPGVFNDSLPDGWGRLLFDRAMRAAGRAPAEASPLDRLAHVGRNGMGALVYEPDYGPVDFDGSVDLDHVADQARGVIEGAGEDVLAELIALNGSSAGARPKAMVGYNPDTGAMIHGAGTLPAGFEHWLVKFPNTQDGPDAGAVEYVYSLMAKAAGLEMTDTRLFPARRGSGHFGTRRFDRAGPARLHIHTASGLLHADHRTPSLDYRDLVALTSQLTRDSREAAKMFRIAAFNVLAHNRDDHAKNFTFLMDPSGDWRLSPAYDLTFSSGPGGEQSTLAMGEGKAPGAADLVRLGERAGLSGAFVQSALDQTREALAGWKALAKQHGVSAASIRQIASRISP